MLAILSITVERNFTAEQTSVRLFQPDRPLTHYGDAEFLYHTPLALGKHP